MDLNGSVNERNNNNLAIASVFVGFLISAYLLNKYWDAKKKNRISAGVNKAGGLLSRKKLAKTIEEFDDDLDAMMDGTIKSKPIGENFKVVKTKPTTIENHEDIARALKALIDSNQLSQVLGEIENINITDRISDVEEKSDDVSSSAKKPLDAVLAEMRSPSIKAAAKQKPAKAARKVHKYAVHPRDFKNYAQKDDLYSSMRRRK